MKDTNTNKTPGNAIFKSMASAISLMITSSNDIVVLAPMTITTARIKITNESRLTVFSFSVIGIFTKLRTIPIIVRINRIRKIV